MAAPDQAKLQANFKLADGTLINVYAATPLEFEQLLTTVQDAATLITATSSALGASAPASRSAVSAAAIVAGGDKSAPICKHGAMVYREGVGAKGPWKGFMCSAPKGAADKCDTIWSK